MDPPYDALLTWAVEALGSVDIRDIAMASSPDLLIDELASCQGVFIGGGNVYSLLYRLRSTQADRRLRAFAEDGHPVYGGSAGAVILGRDIDTARHIDPNDVGLVDTTGLDLALGNALWCHYVVGDDPLIHNYVRETGNVVLAIPERGGLARTGQEIRVLGPEPSRFFGLARGEWLEPGDAVPVIG
jgi:dipeptidase E